MKRFYSDAKEGKLPQFSLIDPRIMDLPFLGVANDDHPPHGIFLYIYIYIYIFSPYFFCFS